MADPCGGGLLAEPKAKNFVLGFIATLEKHSSLFDHVVSRACKVQLQSHGSSRCTVVRFASGRKWRSPCKGRERSGLRSAKSRSSCHRNSMERFCLLWQHASATCPTHGFQRRRRRGDQSCSPRRSRIAHRPAGPRAACRPTGLLAEEEQQTRPGGPHQNCLPNNYPASNQHSEAESSEHSHLHGTAVSFFCLVAQDSGLGCHKVATVCEG